MNQVKNGQTIHSLTFSYTEGSASLSLVPDLLKRVLEGEMWREFIVESTGQKAGFDSFEEFVVEKIPCGMGATIDDLRRLCSNRNDILTLIDETLVRPVGRPQTQEIFEEEILYNVQDKKTTKAPTGNSKEAGLRRLRTKSPKLHEEVVKGTKSVHAACVEAGFRKRTSQIKKAQDAVKNMTQDEFEEFKKWLEEYTGDTDD